MNEALIHVAKKAALREAADHLATVYPGAANGYFFASVLRAYADALALPPPQPADPPVYPDAGHYPEAPPQPAPAEGPYCADPSCPGRCARMGWHPAPPQPAEPADWEPAEVADFLARDREQRRPTAGQP